MRSIARALTARRRSIEFAVVAVRIVAGHVEKRLRDRQRGAQFVGGVGCESLLFGAVCFEPGEHGVEGVGEFAELVSAAREPDSVGERSGRGRAGGVGDASEGGEHPAGEQPSSEETDTIRNTPKMAAAGAKSRRRAPRPGYMTTCCAVDDDGLASGYVSQEEHPHGAEQQGAGDHDEAGIAEGEFEANAQPRGSIHGLLPHARRPVECRCGSRRRPRWR